MRAAAGRFHSLGFLLLLLVPFFSVVPLDDPEPQSEYWSDVNSLRVTRNVLFTRGWVFDVNSDDPVEVQIFLDGNRVAITLANVYRPDVGEFFERGDYHGFLTEIPVPYGNHEICLSANDRTGLIESAQFHCRQIEVTTGRPENIPEGYEESLEGTVSDSAEQAAFFPQVNTWERAVEALSDQAIDEFASGAVFRADQRSWIAIGATLFGVALCIRKRSFSWLIAPFLLFLWMIGIAAAENPGFLQPIVAPFYGRDYRLAAGLAAISGALITLALIYPISYLKKRVLRGTQPGWFHYLFTAFVAIAFVSIYGFINHNFQSSTRLLRTAELSSAALVDDEHSWLLDTSEFEMQAGLQRVLEPGALVLGDPGVGAGYLYGLFGIPVVFPHTDGLWDTDSQYLAEFFYQIKDNPSICSILTDRNIKYFYYDPILHGNSNFFGLQYVNTEELAEAGILKQIASGGTATVFEIQGCEPVIAS